MSNVYKLIVRPLLFLLSPELAHKVAFFCIKYYPFSFQKKESDDSSLEKKCMGLTFKNPIGLAAGFDKDALLLDKWHRFGFGFVEVGTITLLPQKGNPKPRLFRLKKDKALINRMGFNNDGVDIIVERLKKYQKNKKITLGVNIGKNTKTTSPEAIISDYLKVFKKVADYADYVALNISCPNIGDISILQENDFLDGLLEQINRINQSRKKTPKILLKISPDLSENQLDDIIKIVKKRKLYGIIASNTSVSRSNLHGSKKLLLSVGNGGLSGYPLSENTNRLIRYIAKYKNKDFVLIAVGGIMTPQEVQKKLDLGADLIQIYTGFIYEGPSLISESLKKLSVYD